MPSVRHSILICAAEPVECWPAVVHRGDAVRERDNVSGPAEWWICRCWRGLWMAISSMGASERAALAEDALSLYQKIGYGYWFRRELHRPGAKEAGLLLATSSV